MAHFTGCGRSKMEHPKVWSPCRKALQGSKSGRKSHKGKKSKEGASAKVNKPRGSPTESNPVASFQEQAKRP